MREAEERATNLLDNNSQFERQQGKVQIPNLNPHILFNARGNPYVEGDPNLGYSLEDIKPQTVSRASGFSPPQPESDPSPSSPAHKQASNLPHSQPKYNPLPNQNHQSTLRNHSPNSPIQSQTK